MLHPDLRVLGQPHRGTVRTATAVHPGQPAPSQPHRPDQGPARLPGLAQPERPPPRLSSQPNHANVPAPASARRKSLRRAPAEGRVTVLTAPATLRIATPTPSRSASVTGTPVLAAAEGTCRADRHAAGAVAEGLQARPDPTTRSDAPEEAGERRHTSPATAMHAPWHRAPPQARRATPRPWRASWPAPVFREAAREDRPRSRPPMPSGRTARTHLARSEVTSPDVSELPPCAFAGQEPVPTMCATRPNASMMGTVSSFGYSSS